MNEHKSWLFSAGYVLRLMDIAAALEKPYHNSHCQQIAPLLECNWLIVVRETEHKTWYELTDLAQELVYRLLCNYFEMFIPLDELAIYLAEKERLAWLQGYRQGKDEIANKLLAWLDERGLAYEDIPIDEGFIRWTQSENIAAWQWQELFIIVREKGKSRDSEAQHQALQKDHESELKKVLEG